MIEETMRKSHSRTAAQNRALCEGTSATNEMGKSSGTEGRCERRHIELR